MKKVLKAWMARTQAFRDRITTVAMDGFTGYKTATSEELPKARVVMDPFHVVHLAAGKLDLCRQRVQQQVCGHRGRKNDPLYKIRRRSSSESHRSAESSVARFRSKPDLAGARANSHASCSRGRRCSR